jgi:hypothetical protein
MFLSTDCSTERCFNFHCIFHSLDNVGYILITSYNVWSSDGLSRALAAVCKVCVIKEISLLIWLKELSSASGAL